jgi:hypothetical protein
MKSFAKITFFFEVRLRSPRQKNKARLRSLFARLPVAVWQSMEAHWSREKLAFLYFPDNFLVTISLPSGKLIEKASVVELYLW